MTDHPTRRVLLTGSAAAVAAHAAARWPRAPSTADDGIVVVPGRAASTSTSESAAAPAAAPAAPAIPERWGCVGDSMTHGVVGAAESIPAFMTKATGVAFDDLGVIAQTSTEIVARIGASPVRLRVVGDILPASGAVSLRALNPLVVNHTGPDAVINGRPVQRVLLGTLCGVSGYLTRDLRDGLPNDQVPISAFSFVRLGRGDPTPCPPGSRFIPDLRAGYRRSPLIVRMGYNNRFDYDQVVADHQALFGWNRPEPNRMLLLDPPISYYDDVTRVAASRRIAAFLEGAASARGVRYFSIHGYVTSRRGLRDAGVDPTADDLAAIADGRTPMSATVGDGLHYTAAINRAVAARLAEVLRLPAAA